MVCVMRLCVFLGVYEAERVIAARTLRRLLTILDGHQVSLVILDDASPGRLGEALAREFAPRIAGTVEVRRIETSTGYHGSIERTFSVFDEITARSPTASEAPDYVLRVDADIGFGRSDLARLFAPGVLPAEGLFGGTFAMRRRDLLLFCLDLLPIGFRRRRVGERLEHGWQLRRTRPVWWSVFGWRALRRGFRGRIVPGSFQIIAWATLLEMRRQGALTRSRRTLGLVFGEDVITNAAVWAVGHRVIDVGELVPDWDFEHFLTPGTTAADLVGRSPYYLHPLKDEAWANALRDELDEAADRREP